MTLVSLLLLLHLFLVNCSTPLVPALYIFGDSIVDSGNNDFLNTSSKVNYNPYGIDFPAGPTGRFTNGLTSVDFLVSSVAPAPYHLRSEKKKKFLLGFNQRLRSHSPRKSLFTMVPLDYVNNYLLPTQYNSSHLYTPEQFASILLKEFRQHIQKLYNLGARKFVVFNLGPLGCLPAMIKLENITIGCATRVNQLVSLYNKGFPSMIQEMRTSLKSSSFVQGDVNLFSNGLSQNPSGEILRLIHSSINLDHLHESWYICTNLHGLEQHISSGMDVIRHNRSTCCLRFGCFYGPIPCSPINVLQLVLEEPGNASQQSHFVP
ncbi:hypothetical protein NE237_025575 [Protea cynaroides]|uniref:GDSL esterase/lipase n=1 Tax=Protea cynaroides TaxID=273540 RepID=A0A9Q0H7B0_9MAGN|nr:hypothetical protein NE237_025575 [Protea cynaroides]